MSRAAVGMVTGTWLAMGVAGVARADEPRERMTLGLPPSAVTGGDSISRGGAGPDGQRAPGKMDFSGFLRAPLRVGISGDDDVEAGVEGGSKLHVPPQTPDTAYTDWRYTNVQGGSWAEMLLAYKAGRATAHVALAAHDFSDASYRDPQSQMGVSQAFVTVDAGGLFGKKGGLIAYVGAFAYRYGAPGQYDAGKYDTYLIGTTHVGGETLSFFYDVSKDFTLHLDHGIGAKLNVPTLVDALPPAPHLPYPGDVQQGTTFLHHVHAGVSWKDKVIVGIHQMTEWNDDARLADEVDGKLSVLGVDAKWLGTKWGDGYIGFSHVDVEDPLRLAGAIELLHSFEGWSVRDNYFGEAATQGGTIDALLWQHTFSLARLLWPEGDYWGQAPDLQISTFGLLTLVDSDDPNFDAAKKKLKLGGEVVWTPKGWLGVGLRYDLVQPDLDDNTESFHVVSPRVIFRSGFTANEEITVQYSRYVYADNVFPAYPNETLTPDENVVKIQAAMWW